MKKILGIDPGTAHIGYAILILDNDKISLLNSGFINLKGPYSTQKLKIIYNNTCQLISDYYPDVLAIETQFLGKNVQTMLKLGRAQGVSILAGLNNNIEVVEYPPSLIKILITGKGNSTKQTVAEAVARMLNIDISNMSYDITDAIAIALSYTKTQKGK